MKTDRPHSADDHEEAAHWAVRLAGREPDAAEQAELEAWLAADDRNVERLDDIFQSWAAVESYAAAEPIMALREQALADTRAVSGLRDWHGWSWRGTLAAATIILCMIGGGVWLSLQPTRYDTGIGERRVVMLDDGSTVSIDAGSRLSVDYTHGRRDLVIDEGRAKFTVAKDPLRPFAVRAGSKVIVATGTQFSVERVGEQVRVILYEGNVALLDGQGSDLRPIALKGGKGKLATMLEPKQEVTLPVAAHLEVAAVAPVDTARSLGWESGQLVFVDEPLSDVVARVNRYAERPLRVGDDAARQIRVSGVFRAGETEGLVQGLKAAFGARIVEEPNAVAIFSS